MLVIIVSVWFLVMLAEEKGGKNVKIHAMLVSRPGDASKHLE